MGAAGWAWLQSRAGVLLWVVWRISEGVNLTFWPAQPVHPGSLLRTRTIRHEGPALTLEDGTRVEPHDPLLEVHLDNGEFIRRRHAGAGTFEDMEGARGELATLEARRRRQEIPSFVAMKGASHLYPAARRLGFEVRPLAGGMYPDLLTFYLAGLTRFSDPSTVWGHVELKRRRPAEIWMSAERLHRLYGDSDREPKPPVSV